MPAAAEKPHPQAKAQPDAPLVIIKANYSFEAFGAVLHHLSKTEPFSHFEFGHFAGVVRNQLRSGNHLVAMRGAAMVGYVGWLDTTAVIGELWQAGLGQLASVKGAECDAAALTVVWSLEPLALRRLIRGARNLNPGKRVFFKRQYGDGKDVTRKSSVQNRFARPVSLVPE